MVQKLFGTLFLLGFSFSLYAQTSANQAKSQKPVEPVYERCDATDYACMQRNRLKENDYLHKVRAWNELQKEEARDFKMAQSEEQQRALAEIQASSATEALRKAQEQNQKSARRSNEASTVTQSISTVFGVAFAASCVYGCNDYLLASSVAFNMISSKHSDQASENYDSAFAACQTQAKLKATSSSNCSAFANQSVGPTPLVPNIFDKNGNCVASDKSMCDQIIARLPPGTDIKDVAKGVSAFATDPPYKKNPDGSVTTKDGKTFKQSDFSSKEALMAAGLSADQAAATMDLLNKAGFSNSGLEKAKADLKNSDKNKKIDFGGAAIAGGAELGSVTDASGALSSQSIGEDGLDSGKRIPAGEGLTRDFNGETIGAAGDDIFIMMNRRYKMKIAQDSFISN